MAETQSFQDQAIAWHLKLPDLPGEQWADFVAWLEGAPEHRAAYDKVAAADAIAAQGLAAMPAASALTPPSPARTGLWRRHARGAGFAMAACLALVAAVGLWPRSPGPQVEQTQPGTTKQLAFADGTRIDLNGESALAIDQANPRAVRLDQGEARFAVHHGDKPFTVKAGGFTLRDLGTVFNVRLSDKALVLDVTEGSVLFDPGGANLTVLAGEQVSVDRRRNLVVKREGVAAGDWLRGDLVFDNATLADVAEAIHRRYGTEISLSAGLPERPFTGNIHLSGNAAADVARLVGLIGARYHREAEAWVITGTADRR